MYCQYCGHQNAEGNKFCEACGKALAIQTPMPPLRGAAPLGGVSGQGKPGWLRRLPSIGAAIVVVCFFLPWILVSCNVGFGPDTELVKASGYEIASGNYDELKDLQNNVESMFGSMGDMFGSGGDWFGSAGDLLGSSVSNAPDSYHLLWFVFVFGVIGLLSINGRSSGRIAAIVTGILGLISMIIFSIRASSFGEELSREGFKLQYQEGFLLTWIGFAWLFLSAILISYKDVGRQSPYRV
jgi:hypothetical protein